MSISGCGSPPSVQATKNDQVTREQFDRLAKQVSDIDAQTLNARLDKTAILEPTGKGFSFIRSDAGILSLTFKNIQPFADGSRVTLSVGNPLSADITKLESHLEWGPVDQRGMMIYDPRPREMDYTLKTLLRAGSWTDVVIDLPGVTPSKFGMLIVTKLSVATMQLNK